MDGYTNDYEQQYGRVIRSTIQPRGVVIQRTIGPVRSQMTIERSTGYSSGGMRGAALALSSTPGVTAVKSSREKEKKDMQDLNERFASYIEKVRFLEAQNRKLGDELDKLKSKWGKETSNIKQMYQTELDEAKRLLEESEKEKQRLQIRVAALEEQIEELKRKLEEATQALDDSREKLERQNQQLADYEAEINLLKRRIELLDGDRDKNKRILARLQDSLNRARIDLDNEQLLHMDAENRRQALEEELEFLKQVHDQELKELAALAYRDTTSENRELWKSEMGSALREMQQLYDTKMDDLRGEMDTFYSLKVQEFRAGANRQNVDSVHAKEETIRLRSQFNDLQGKLNDLQARNDSIQREIDQLRRDKEERERELEADNARLMGDVAGMRAEMESITKELQDLLDTKLGLELEIAAYRKLLEGEEDRQGLRQVVDSMFGALASSYGSSDRRFRGVKNLLPEVIEYEKELHGLRKGTRPGRLALCSPYLDDDEPMLNVNQVVKGDMLAKTTYQRSAKGPLSISESSADGKYVCFENTGRRDEVLSNWTLRRNVDGSEMPLCQLPTDFKIAAGSKAKVYCRGGRPRDAPSSDIEVPSYDSFGQGKDITTRLCNPAGEERATLIQKTIYT